MNLEFSELPIVSDYFVRKSELTSPSYVPMKHQDIIDNAKRDKTVAWEGGSESFDCIIPMLQLKEQEQMRELQADLATLVGMNDEVSRAHRAMIRVEIHELQLEMNRENRSIHERMKTWEARHALSRNWRQLRNPEVRERMENEDRHFVSKGSVWEQQTQLDRLASKAKMKADWEAAHPGETFPKRWKKSQFNQSNKTKRGTAGL